MKIYPNSVELARCKLCLQPIAWALTYPNRRKVPLDRPITTTNLATDADGHQYAELTSKTHFETCPKYDPETRQVRQEPQPTPINQPSLF